jgi:hypothetical protein
MITASIAAIEVIAGTSTGTPSDMRIFAAKFPQATQSAKPWCLPKPAETQQVIRSNNSTAISPSR